MLVAIAGYKTSGKSSAAQPLLQTGWVEVKFADPLKNMLRAYYATCGLSPQDIEARIEGDLKEVPDPWLVGQTPRLAMQRLGSEWRHMIDPNLWFVYFESRVLALLKADYRVVCTDLRTPSECARIQDLGGTSIWIDRPGLVSGSHESEQGISHLCDYIVCNDSTIERLQQRIVEIIG